MNNLHDRILMYASLFKDPYTNINSRGYMKIVKDILDSAAMKLWKDAQGDDLPPIDKEVIVIDIRGKVSYGHRPDPKGFDCKNIDTGKIEHLEPMTYDKGGWNFPDIKYWLDLDLPNLEHEL